MKGINKPKMVPFSLINGFGSPELSSTEPSAISGFFLLLRCSDNYKLGDIVF